MHVGDVNLAPPAPDTAGVLRRRATPPPPAHLVWSRSSVRASRETKRVFAAGHFCVVCDAAIGDRNVANAVGNIANCVCDVADAVCDVPHGVCEVTYTANDFANSATA